MSFKKLKIKEIYPKTKDWFCPAKILILATKWNQYMRTRKEYLHFTASKLHLANEIYKTFPLKTITFAETTNFVDTLASITNGVACHSKKTNKENKIAFCKNTIQLVLCVGRRKFNSIIMNYRSQRV